MKSVLAAIFVVANVACAGDGGSAATHQSGAAARSPKMQSGGRKAALEAVKSIEPEMLRIEPDSEQTPSGIATRLIQAGTGTRRVSNDDAVVLYSQTYDTAGRVMARGQELIGDPARDLNKHGQEAIQMMFEGEIRRFWFPGPKGSGARIGTDFEIVWISPEPDDSGQAKSTSTRK